MTYEIFVVKYKHNYEIFVFRSENMERLDMASSLKWFLEKKKITALDLSKKTGIKENLILKILNKKHVFNAYQLLLICDAIDTEPMLIIWEYKNKHNFLA